MWIGLDCYKGQMLIVLTTITISSELLQNCFWNEQFLFVHGIVITITVRFCL